jgi:hypothetical protein
MSQEQLPLEVQVQMLLSHIESITALMNVELDQIDKSLQELSKRINRAKKGN